MTARISAMHTIIGTAVPERRSGMACKATESGKVSRRGQPSIEWYKDGKPQYYCYGYIDKMTDELLVECKECRSHVYKAQGELDKYNCRKE